MTKTLSRALTLILGAIALSQIAPAASISFLVNLPDPPTAPNPLDPAHTFPISGTAATVESSSIPQFQASLGTLFQIEYSVTLNYYFSDLVTNNSSSNQDVGLSPRATFNFSFGDGNGFNSASNLTGQNYFFLPSHTIGLSGTQSVTLLGASGDLAYFTGAGNVPFTFSVNNFLLAYNNGFGGDPSTISSTLSGQFNASLDVTYDYTSPDGSDTPEPASMFSLGGGLLLLAGFRKGIPFFRHSPRP